ncbi:MAG: non-canonical purine NTP diphosphatase [Mangrovibacterium sp.]
MTLVFATNNTNKLKELQHMVGDSVRLLSLEDIGCREEIPETETTLEGNAFLKASYVYRNYGYDCFADDTGLEVEALDGAPGVYSARYAGEDNDASANMDKLLRELEGKDNRRARFRTVISLIRNGEEVRFDGVIEGSILKERRGTGGFGYDPVFMPDGYSRSFAEMDVQKHAVSHRARAVRKLIDWLRQHHLKKDAVPDFSKAEAAPPKTYGRG